MVLPPLDEQAKNGGLQSVLLINSSVVLFGFLGAYFFSLQMLFRRFVTNDLRAKAYITASIRIIMAMIGAWILQVLFGGENSNLADGILHVVVFTLGMFPPVLWGLVKAGVGKIPGLVIPNIVSTFPVTDLDGLTIWHKARLEEEDVENGYNMANVNIINLLLNTKYPADRIIDWIDQAVLQTVLGVEVDSADESGRSGYVYLKNRFRTVGIRTATGLDQFKDDNGQWSPDAVKFLKERGVEEAEIGTFISVANAVENYTNISLIRNWKRPIRVAV